MGKGFSRIERVADLIQTALAEIIQRQKEELNVGMITITSVTVSPDFSHAKVFVSVLDEEKAEQTIEALNNSTKFLRYELAHAVKMRITPELKFIYDDSILHGNRISSLINDALKQKNSQDDK